MLYIFILKKLEEKSTETRKDCFINCALRTMYTLNSYQTYKRK